MKKIAVLAAAAASTLFAANADAQTAYNWGGFYAGAFAGGAFASGRATTPDPTSTSPGAPFVWTGAPPANANLDPSFSGGLRGGYNMQVGWPGWSSMVLGLEVQGGYLHVSGSQGFAGIPNDTAKTRIGDWYAAITPRLGYGFDLGFGSMLASVRAGVAFTNARAGVNTGAVRGAPGVLNASQTVNAFGAAIGGGLEWAFLPSMPNLTLTADYLFLNTAQQVHACGRDTGVGSAGFGGTYCTAAAVPSVHLVNIGLNWHFGAPAAPPPATTFAAPPPPPPAAVPAKQMFIVFFEFDKSSLTADGKKVVDAAAAAFKSGKSGVAIAGYTDLAGTAQYNLALSKRRADTVKAALVRDGVPAAAIDESWHGKTNPRVPTADGVREPQNRRVEITM